MSDVVRLNSQYKNPKKSPWVLQHNRIRATNLDGIDPRAKREGLIKLKILKAFKEELLGVGKPKWKAISEFLALYNSGLLLAETSGKPRHISRSSLYSWNRKFRKDGFVALVPRWKYKKKPRMDLPVAEPFPTLYKIVIPGPPRSRGKKEFQAQLRHRWKGTVHSGPIIIALFFGLPIRKGTKMRRRMQMLKGQISHIEDPNLDRLITFVLDCMTGIIFRSHLQIIRFHAEKNYRWNPETRIFVRILSK